MSVHIKGMTDLGSTGHARYTMTLLRSMPWIGDQGVSFGTLYRPAGRCTSTHTYTPALPLGHHGSTRDGRHTEGEK